MTKIINIAFLNNDIFLLLKSGDDKKYIHRLSSKGEEKGKKDIENILKSDEIYLFECDNKGFIRINQKVLDSNEIK